MFFGVGWFSHFPAPVSYVVDGNPIQPPPSMTLRQHVQPALGTYDLQSEVLTSMRSFGFAGLESALASNLKYLPRDFTIVLGQFGTQYVDRRRNIPWLHSCPTAGRCRQSFEAGVCIQTLWDQSGLCAIFANRGA